VFVGIGVLVGYLRRRRHNGSHSLQERDEGIQPIDLCAPETPALGSAALSAFSVGVAGDILGMAQVWFVGPVGKRVGGAFGGDVGF